jgi:hypothetical protein
VIAFAVPLESRATAPSNEESHAFVVERWRGTKVKEKIKDWTWRVIYTIWAVLVLGAIAWGLFVLVRNIIHGMMS